MSVQASADTCASVGVASDKQLVGEASRFARFPPTSCLSKATPLQDLFPALGLADNATFKRSSTSTSTI
jgi:hypothetical protein